MSEYQYYELVAVDRQLSRDEMGYLRGISSRAQISPTRFCNTFDFLPAVNDGEEVKKCILNYPQNLVNSNSCPKS